MNICVVGAGAIGGWIAARLALAGNAVTALTSGGPLDTVLISEDGETQEVKLARSSGPADILLLAVKAPSLARAAQAARPLIGERTLVVPMLTESPGGSPARLCSQWIRTGRSRLPCPVTGS